MYFENMPTINYKFSSGEVIELKMQDIFRKVNFKQKTFENETNFETYKVKDGETPDDVAYNFYGDANLWWVVLMSNNIIDINNEWAKSVRELSRIYQNFLLGNSYFIFESLDIIKDDILVKRDVTLDGSVDIENFGIIYDYDPFLRKIDVKRSKGTISENDEFYIYRKGSNDQYYKISGFGNTACAIQNYGGTSCTQILGPTSMAPYCAEEGVTFGIIQKKTTIENSIVKFEYQSQEVNPYSVIEGNSPTGDYYTNSNICGLTGTILYKYIAGESLSNMIDEITVGVDIIRTNDQNRNIKLISSNILPEVIKEFISLIDNSLPLGTTRYIQSVSGID
jgi:hypothetical protein